MGSSPQCQNGQTFVVFAPKNDEKMRFYVDYKMLNAMTVRDTYPLPRMNECVDSLGIASIFCKTDCSPGYCQIEISEADGEKTSFSSHHGLCGFIQMPFGLQTARASCRRASGHYTVRSEVANSPGLPGRHHRLLEIRPRMFGICAPHTNTTSKC